MSRERHLLDTLGSVCGWTLATKYELLLDYVQNQDSPEALKDFLLDAAYDELEGTPIGDLILRTGMI